MTEERKDGINEPPAALTVEDTVEMTRAVFQKTLPAWGMLGLLDLLKSAVGNLQHYIKKGKAGISWDNPFAQLEYEVKILEEDDDEEAPADKPSAPADHLTIDEAVSLGETLLDIVGSEVSLLEILTRDVHIRQEETASRVILPPEVEAEVKSLPEAEQDAKVKKLAAGFENPSLKMEGATDTPAGPQRFALSLVFAIRPLTLDVRRGRGFYPIQVGLDFTEGKPAALSEEDREAIWSFMFEQIDAMAAPHLKALEDQGGDRPSVPKPDRAVPIRTEYFHAPGRLFDTPRNAAKQGDLPAIGRWYMQTAFNRTVGMAAAALTKTDTREAILDWQSATVDEVADLVFCRSEEGTLAHGQNREDILKAFESLRAIPVPIVRIDWKQVGTDRSPRWVKEYKLRVASLLQSYGAVFVDKKTGQEAFAADPIRKPDKVKGRTDRRKTIKALVAQNPADGILESFPPDRYTLTRFEWRWNTDIAEDFICPQVALDKKGRPRLKLKKGRHIEGSRFINLNRRYFAVQKHLREAGSKYAPRLLDLIVSEKTHITSRGKGAVWIEIQADKVIKWLDLWVEYQGHPKHVMEDHVAPAVMALIREKVMLPESWLVPQLDKNPDRRKTAFFRWKVAELWSTVALVPPEEAKEVEAELVKEAEGAQSQPEPKTDQAVLPGLEEPPAVPIPAGSVIRAAREAAGLNLRDFASMMDGPAFKTWSLIETGKRSTSAGRIPEAVWKRVRDFIAQHEPAAGTEGGLFDGKKADLSHDRRKSVT